MILPALAPTKWTDASTEKSISKRKATMKATTKHDSRTGQYFPAFKYDDGRIETFSPSSFDEGRALDIAIQLLESAEGDARKDWRYEVANGDTVLGFEEWKAHKAESKANDQRHTSKSHCGNCEWTGEPAKLLGDIPDLFERIEPGNTVPSGECPECGALCYESEAEALKQEVRTKAIVEAAKERDALKMACAGLLQAFVPSRDQFTTPEQSAAFNAAKFALKGQQ